MSASCLTAVLALLIYAAFLLALSVNPWAAGVWVFWIVAVLVDYRDRLQHGDRP